jgi:hypothetical protein
VNDLHCGRKQREQLAYLPLFKLLARSNPTPAPISCARINAGTELSSIPANVSEKARANVTAGLAKDVEEVKKYAAPIHPATANGTYLPFF